MNKPLSDRLLKILSFIHQSTERKGFSPTIKEIADHFDIAAPSALAHVNRLDEAGYIQREPRQWRAIKVIHPPSPRSMPVKEVHRIPVVGRVAAGQPILASENIEDELLVDPAVVRSGGLFFALKVKGDSMIGAGIKEGDYLIARQQPTADSGDIVVAIIGEEATVKRLRIEPDQVTLVPENKRHKPIAVRRKDEFSIAGKAVAVYRVAG